MELVVGASEATMKSLLGKLGGLLAQEYTLIRGVRRDIQYITDELSSMQAFLRDLSSAPDGQDNRMKDWMKQIRDIAYDCEDCIDNFAHRLPDDSISDVRCSVIARRINEILSWWPRRAIASSIADLKVRAQQIAERRSRYGVNNPSNANGSGSGARAATFDIAEHQLASRQLIGIKDPVGLMTDMENLEKWVNKPDAGRAVLSIVGFGGVGKTTIATALYRKVSNIFDCRASVTVSQNYDQDAVLKSMLNQVMPQDRGHEQHSTGIENLEEKNLAAQIRSRMKRSVPLTIVYSGTRSSDTKQMKPETMDHDQLVEELKRRLTEKRYLLLIDDIWSAKTWESIRICLPENNAGSRIIVTTRFQAVGATCSQRDGIDLLHTVDFLNVDDSKRLFDQSVSESQSSRHGKKVQDQVPEEIWKICGGLPLAIVTIAGLVACNPSKSEVCKSLFPVVDRLTLDGVSRILDCCYNDLPGDLKTCTLYLSIFPKGWKISRKRLTRRWIAEGFVSEKQGLTEEEVAETYFNQLMRRKILRPVEHCSNGKVKTFQVHDMVLEYIVSKSSEENFITVVGGHWMMSAPSNKVRRLSMQSNGSKHGNSTKGINLCQVRSLTVFGSLNQLPFRSFNNGIIQVLDLEGWKGLKEKHLNDICKMLVLKYLSLRQTEIAKIPSNIEKLEYLETLDIRDTNVGELPRSVGQLKRISSILGGSKNPQKGLRLPEEKGKDPRKSMLPQEKRKDGMKALRVLSGIEIVGESTAVAGLHQLTGLRKLAIYKLSIQKHGDTFKELRSSIEYLCSCGLQTLAINDESSDFINSLESMSSPPIYLIALELSGKLERPPQWITKLHSLNKLTLSVTILRTDSLELLRTLSSLFSLTFSLSATKQDQEIEDILEKNKSQSDGEIFIPFGFPSLKLLRISAPLVPKLGFSENAMPALEIIEMRFETFEGLLGIDTLEKLQEVHLRVNDQADEITKLLVDDLKNNNNGLKVLRDERPVWFVRKETYLARVPGPEVWRWHETSHLLSKCGGLPSVLITVARYLARKTRYVEVLKQEMRRLSDNFMEELMSNPEFAESLRGLQAWLHSYIHACPRQLRRCILYLSIFPQDIMLRRRRLIRRWIAEGYSSKGTDSSSMEKYTEKILDDVATLSIMQPVLREGSNKVIIGYRVNGLFREYVLSRPVEEAVLFPVEVFALEKLQGHGHGRQLPTDGTGQHLAIGRTWEEDRIFFQSLDFSRLRSMTLFDNTFWSYNVSDRMMSMLRVLDLENATNVIDDDFEDIGKLPSRLKFLSLRGQSGITRLPDCVGDLVQLQTLDIRGTSIRKLPPFITRLQKLEYICAGTSVAWTTDDAEEGSPPTPPSSSRSRRTLASCLPNKFIRRAGGPVVVGSQSHSSWGVVVPSGIKRLKALQTLGAVCLNTADGEAILFEIVVCLPQLKKLQVSGISGKQGQRSLYYLYKKTHLESLSLQFEENNPFVHWERIYIPKSLRSLKMYGHVEQLPRNIGDRRLENFVKLTLEMATLFTAEVIEHLGSLHNLQTLRLRVNKDQDGELQFPATEHYFRKLHILEIACKSMLHLRFDEGAMQKLEHLRLHCLRGSVMQVSGLEHPVSLKQVCLLRSFDDALEQSVQQQLDSHHRKVPAPKLVVQPRSS